MKKIFTIVVSLFFASIPFFVSAHPGRTDSVGCHTCRTNCAKWGLSTGEYHCHQAKALPQPEEPVKSHFSETGGYTTPAPEYKQPKQPVVQPTAQQVTQPTNEIKQTENKVESTPVAKTEDTKKTNGSWWKRFFKFIFG